MSAEVNFVRQQGFGTASPEGCALRYPALMWQPRVIGVIVLLGLALQSWLLFCVLGTVLWWNVLAPRLNPFDAMYNALVAGPRGWPRLESAPSPRRFSQGMAGTFMLSISVALFTGAWLIAVGLETMLAVALGALVFGRFCLGSYLYFLFTGQAAFARETLPWARARAHQQV
jgi:uncharacterized protein DUF4395